MNPNQGKISPAIIHPDESELHMHKTKVSYLHLSTDTPKNQQSFIKQDENKENVEMFNDQKINPLKATFLGKVFPKIADIS